MLKHWSAAGGPAADAYRALVASEGASIDVYGSVLDDVENAFVAHAGGRIGLVDAALGPRVRRDVAVWTEDAWPPSQVAAQGLASDGRTPVVLVQHGSTLEVDGLRQETTALDAEALRAAGLLGR